MGTDSEAKENVLLQYDASSYLQSIGSFHKCQRSLGETIPVKSGSINLRLMRKKMAVLTAEGSSSVRQSVESKIPRNTPP